MNNGNNEADKLLNKHSTDKLDDCLADLQKRCNKLAATIEVLKDIPKVGDGAFSSYENRIWFPDQPIKEVRKTLQNLVKLGFTYKISDYYLSFDNTQIITTYTIRKKDNKLFETKFIFPINDKDLQAVLDKLSNGKCTIVEGTTKPLKATKYTTIQCNM